MRETGTESAPKRSTAAPSMARESRQAEVDGVDQRLRRLVVPQFGETTAPATRALSTVQTAGGGGSGRQDGLVRRLHHRDLRRHVDLFLLRAGEEMSSSRRIAIYLVKFIRS